jgi:hypothetical protein
MTSQLRSRRLLSLWIKSLETADRVKIDRRHRKLVAVKKDVSACSFLFGPFFVFNNKLYKDRSLKI